MEFSFLNDEPTSIDSLDRSKYAEAFAQLIQSCQTPMVIGIYGTWGVGKTSLMKLIKSKLDNSNKIKSIWFDPWQHQFDEDPAVALLHTMVDDLKIGDQGKKLLTIIATALSSILLKSTTSLSITDIQELGEKYEKERFLIREKQINLRKNFEDLIKKATKNGKNRLVFFIDDLDRCMPEQALKVLEALKLFLNLPNCTYVIGVDRFILERNIKCKYKENELNETSYLDKIIQLPFTIPPITEIDTLRYIEYLLPTDVKEVVPILYCGLGDNPRQIKRFINTFQLNHKLASTTIGKSYSSKLLASILLIQYRQPDFYKSIVNNPRLLVNITSEDLGDYTDLLKNDPSTIQVIKTAGFSSLIDISPYIYLSEMVSAREIRFDVLITDTGNNPVNVIKEYRDLKHCPLLEAKEHFDRGLPITIASDLSRELAETIKKRFVGAGATISII